MDGIAVLVLAEDAKARALLKACHDAVAHLPADGVQCEAALCSQEKFRAALSKIAPGVPALVLAHDLPSDADPAFVAFALRAAAKVSRAQAALTGALDELEQQRSAMMALSTLKSDLIATLAHDIKGPLTSIIGFAELMEEGFMEGADATDAARTIRTNAQRLAALANDILALSRVEHGELEIADDRVNLRDVLTASVQEVVPERAVELEIEPEAAFVRGDAERLRQVFDNVMRNAIKYSPNGDPIRVQMQRSGDNFVIRVTDRGIGIPPEEMVKLFQRFGRASNARKSKIAGTGVGLFIAKTIVERHGGTIGAESILGAGSTFTVTLPAMDAHAPAGPGRVVVITPDARLRRFTAYELRARGFRVLELESLESANGRMHEGDLALVDGDLGSAVRARAMLPAAQRVIGLGPLNATGWDATLGKPYLIGDLIALLPRPLAAPLSS